MDEPVTMWDALQTAFDTTQTAVGRQTIWDQFASSVPVPGEPIGNWFSKLLDMMTRLEGTDEALPEMSVRTQIFRNLPPSFFPAIQREQMAPTTPIRTVMENLKTFESANSLYTNPAGSALATTQKATPKGRGQGSRQASGRGREAGANRGGRGNEDRGGRRTRCKEVG